MTVGIGYDVHPLVKGRPLYLGGVKIPHDKGLKGHSDGDAVLHAIADALLGAAGMGDIGDWYPDTDARFKDARSDGLLSNILRHVSLNWKVVNVDVTIIAAEPRLGPLKKKIGKSIAKILRLPSARVNVKAKSLNQFAPAGAIGCHAIAQLKGKKK